MNGASDGDGAPLNSSNSQRTQFKYELVSAAIVFHVKKRKQRNFLSPCSVQMCRDMGAAPVLSCKKFESEWRVESCGEGRLNCLS